MRVRERQNNSEGKAQRMTPEDLRAIGEALRGPHWKRALARDVGVHERTIKHFASGTRAIPETIPALLRALLARHAQRLQSLARSLE